MRIILFLIIIVIAIIISFVIGFMVGVSLLLDLSSCEDENGEMKFRENGDFINEQPM